MKSTWFSPRVQPQRISEIIRYHLKFLIFFREHQPFPLVPQNIFPFFITTCGRNFLRILELNGMCQLTQSFYSLEHCEVFILPYFAALH